MHEPPRGTPLSEPHGAIAGNREWTSAIERFQPGIVVFGHDHETPLRREQWYYRLWGKTLCVNVGQWLPGPLRYCMMKFSFEQAEPSLATHAEVTAYPAGETVQVSYAKAVS
jgi:Icc-related predicted phosphoesterase